MGVSILSNHLYLDAYDSFPYSMLGNNDKEELIKIVKNSSGSHNIERTYMMINHKTCHSVGDILKAIGEK